MNTGCSPRYIAMAIPNLIKCMLTSSFLIPSLISPIPTTVSLRVLIMWSDVTWLMMPLLEFVEIGEFGVVPGYFLIIFTIAAATLTGQRIASFEAIIVIGPSFCLSFVVQM